MFRIACCAASLLSLGTVQADQLNYYIVKDSAEPFQITHEDAKQDGFITDVVTELAKQAGFELHNIVAPSPRIEILLKDTTLPDWIVYDSPAWNSITEGTQLSTPLMTVTHSVIQCGPEHGFYNDLDGHKLAVIKFFRYPGLKKLADQGKIELVPVKSYQQGFKMVDLHRVDGFIEMDMRLRYHFNMQPTAPTCSTIETIGEAEPSYDIVLKVNKTMSPDKKTRLNDTLETLRNNGSLDRILKTYTGDLK